MTVAIMVSLAYNGVGTASHMPDAVSGVSSIKLPREHSIHTHTLIASRCRDSHVEHSRPPSTWDISLIHKLSMNTSSPAYTAGILSSGGCCDGISATLSDFRVAWGTEINDYQRGMFEALFGAPNLGDTFATSWDSEHYPDFISSGQDCTDYSSSGSRVGARGATGWHFTSQTDIINKLEPSAFKIEMVANALKINNGAEVRKVMNALVGKYYLKKAVVRVESHGDPSNRTRLFIVGMHKRIGERADHYAFPTGKHGTAPHARYIAEPDDNLPPSSWVTRQQWTREGKTLDMFPPSSRANANRSQGHLVKIGQLGEGMGHSSIPNAIYDWDSIYNTQTTYNGGGVRLPLNHKEGDPIERLRKSTPLEAVRIASLDDSYLAFARSFNDDDAFIYQCANAGIPLMTGTAIDKSINKFMRACNVPRRTSHEIHALRSDFTKARSRVMREEVSRIRVMSAMNESSHDTSFDSDIGWGSDKYIRSMQVDTGSDATLGHTDLEPYLQNAKRSRVRIHMVDKTNVIGCSQEGVLNAVVMNTSSHPDIPPSVPFDMPLITVPNLNRELLSVEQPYRDGYSIHLGHHPEPCEMKKGEHRVPFRYDWNDGNFWMDYIPYTGSGSSGARDGDRKAAHDAHVQSVITNAYNAYKYDVHYVSPSHGHLTHRDIPMSRPIPFTYGTRDDPNTTHSRDYFVDYTTTARPICGTVEPYMHSTPDTTDVDNPTLYKCPLTHASIHSHASRTSRQSLCHDASQCPPCPPQSHHFTIKVPTTVNPRFTPFETRESDHHRDICALISHVHDTNVHAATTAKSDHELLQLNTYSPSMVSRIHSACRCHSAIREIIYADDVNARETRGVKEGMRKKARTTIKDFHETHGHLGDCGSKDCIICKAVGGCMRRIYKKVDPHKESRCGYSWVMDGIVFNERSIERHKYLIVLKDAGPSGAIKLIPLIKKSDAIDEVEKWIKSLRNDPVYSHYPYKMCSHIKTDAAGEWRDDNVDWDARIGEGSSLGVKMEYPPPERHESMGLAENACWIVERCIKSILMQQNLPPNYWTRVSRDAEFLLNRFPVVSTNNNVSLDGDRPRPLELLTDSWYSRRQIDRELEYYVPCGTPCLVHCHKAKGSTLGPKVRWGIASGMHRETCHFTCPFTKGPLFRSKSFVAYKLEHGTNYAQFLGLRSLKSTLKSLVLPEDNKISKRNIVTLPKMVERNDVKPPDVRVHNSPPLREIDLDDDDDTTTLPEPTNPPSRDIPSSALNHLSHGNSPRDSDVGARGEQASEKGLPDENKVSGDTTHDHSHPPESGVTHPTPTTPIVDSRSSPIVDSRSSPIVDSRSSHDSPIVDSRSSNDSQRLSREDGMRNAANRHDFTKGPLLLDDDNNVLTTHNDGTLRHADGSHYGTTHTLPTVTSIHKRAPTRGDANNTGFDIDVMSDDQAWDAFEAQQVSSKAYKVNDDTTSLKIVCRKLGLVGGKRDYISLYREWLMNHCPTSDEWDEHRLPVGRGEYLENGITLPYPTGRNWRVMLEEEDDRLMGNITSHVAHAYQSTLKWIKSIHTSHSVTKIGGKKRKRKERDAALEKGLRDPKSLKEAFSLPDGREWRDAAKLEFDTLCDMGVIDHGYTRSELRKLGVYRDPMNVSMALKYKLDVNGCIERRKVRMALAGHPGAMTKGVDYNEVFSPSPNQNTARLMQALLVSRNLHRKCWDIKLAYCNAPLPNNEMIAIRYPRGYERFRGPEGARKEEEFMLLKKNIYGHPAAGKQWSDTRDAYIKERFNRDGWTCSTSVYDPTLFYITHHDQEAWVSIYVDDCDAVGTSEGILNTIYEIINKKWPSRDVSPDYVLGVKRELTIDGDNRTLEMTMTAYIDGVVSSFENDLNSSHWHRRTPSTPFEPHLFLERAEDDAESKEVLGRGYQRLVGCLLWANRGCFPEISVGVHQMCRVMSCPSERAWREGLRILAWLRDNRSRGIKFSSQGNPHPIAYSDASNKPDPLDGLSQYGYCVMWMGGPVMWSSKKLAHVGLSAYHNEYMALRHALSSVVWMRNLFDDINLSYITNAPTIIYGDNEAANRLTRQDFVSSGNQYIYLPYHYLKECVRLGMVDVRWVGTRLNFADIFTKAVAVETIRSLRDKLCGYDNSWYCHRDGAIVDPKLEAARSESSGGLSDPKGETPLLDIIHANVCILMHS